MGPPYLLLCCIVSRALLVCKGIHYVTQRLGDSPMHSPCYWLFAILLFMYWDLHWKGRCYAMHDESLCMLLF